MENDTKTKLKDRELLRVILTAAVLVFALAAYALWIAKGKELTIWGSAAAAISLGLFALALVLMIPKAIGFFAGDEKEEEDAVPLIGERSRIFKRRHPILQIVLITLLVRVILFIVAYILGMILRDTAGSLIGTMESVWLKLDTDAPHYINIAEQGYTKIEPQMYTLVFLPLYPVLIHYFNYVFGNSFVSAMMISTLCSCAAAPLIYELALCDMGRRSARNAVFFAFALPGAIFFAAPMSEALFLLLSCAALLCMRKKKFWLAGLFGGLASFTRSLGFVMLVPFICEAIAYARDKYRENGREKIAPTIVKLVVCGLMILLGTFFYLLINKLLWGDWFKFLEFQRTVWFQRFTPFFGAVATQTNMLVMSAKTEIRDLLALWLPNLIFIFGSLAVLLVSVKKMRVSYLLYFAAYVFVSCGASWLLSAPRYLTALAVLPIALAHLCRSRDDEEDVKKAKSKATAITVLLGIGQLLYLMMYIFGLSIY